jgi:hypothetical protein
MSTEETKPDNVVTHARFMANTTADRVAELKAAGVIPDTQRTLADIPLSELQMGEAVIGELTPEEAILYIAFFDARAEEKRLGQEVTGDMLHKAGDAVKRGDEQFAFGSGADEEAMRDYFRLNRRAELLGASFFWTIGERMKVHDHRLGVRTKGRIVKGARKWGQVE